MRLYGVWLCIYISNFSSCAILSSGNSSEEPQRAFENSSNFENGQSFRQAQVYDLAYPELQKAWLEKPSSDTLYALSENEFQLNLSSLALLKLKSLENKDYLNSDHRLQILLAEVYFNNSLFELAETSYKNAIVKSTNPIPIYWRIFECDSKLGRFESALTILNELENLGEEKSILHFHRGKVLTHLGASSTQQAKLEFKKSIQLRPAFKSAHLALAQLLLDDKEPTESLKTLSLFERKYGPDFDIHKLVSDASIASGDFQEAEQRLQILSKSESYKLTAFQKLAHVYSLQNNTSGRIAALMEVLSIDKVDDKVRLELGIAHLSLQQTQEAQKYFSEIYPESHTYIEGQLKLISYFMSNQQTESAEFKLSQLMQKFPNNPGVRELALQLPKAENLQRSPANIKAETLLDQNSK